MTDNWLPIDRWPDPVPGPESVTLNMRNQWTPPVSDQPTRLVLNIPIAGVVKEDGVVKFNSSEDPGKAEG